MKRSILRIVALMLALMLLVCTTGCAQEQENEETTKYEETMETTQPVIVADTTDDNYRTFYQIFVGSFSDGNNDTVGDLRGIIDRFDYLNDGNRDSETSLGVQGIWLSPIFASPSYHKYDTTDYYGIDWRFGEEKDLVELIELCHSRNVKLILDLAINHTSKQHPWFQAFKQARLEDDTENEYYDYYTCVREEEKVGGRTYQTLGGGWYYECNFSGDMPELNFDNDAVRQEVVNIAKYYLDLGVDGFRFDAVKYIYYGDTPTTVAFWEWYMQELKAIKPDIYCVGECWSGETEILSYYSAMNCFNFAISQAEGVAAMAAKGSSLATFTNYVESYQKKVLEANAEGMPISFLSNHDMDRIGGAFVTENNMRMAANLYLLSPGSPVIYYGEEIGLRGSRGGENTDANRRLAMLWGDDDLVKDPVGSTYSADKQIKTTVADQIADENSLLRYYCKLLSIRHRYDAIARGTYRALSTSEKNLGGFVVSYDEELLVILHNNSTGELSVDLATCKGLNGVTLSTLCEAIGAGEATLSGTVLTVAGQTSVILK